MSEEAGLNIKPELDTAHIHDIVKRNYGLNIVKLQKLDGYDDLNFKIRTHNNGDNDSCEAQERDYVLKVLNRLRSEHPEIIEIHHSMMMHLHKHEIPVSLPVHTVNGNLFCSETLPVQNSDSRAMFVVQLLHFIPGVTFLEAGNPLDILTEVGRLVGKMDTALKKLDREITIEKDNLWELTRLPDMVPYIKSQCSSEDSQLGHDIVRAYTDRVLPVLDKFQSGVIHGDVNNCNIIVNQSSEQSQINNPSAYVISGFIDFMDACSSVYVYELATVMADIMASCLHKHDPFRIAKLIYDGYKKEFCLNEYEIKSLRLIICVRALQAYVLSGIDSDADPGNEFVTLEREGFIDLCRYLWDIEDDAFQNKLIL